METSSSSRVGKHIGEGGIGGMVGMKGTGRMGGMGSVGWEYIELK